MERRRTRFCRFRENATEYPVCGVLASCTCGRDVVARDCSGCLSIRWRIWFPVCVLVSRRRMRT